MFRPAPAKPTNCPTLFSSHVHCIRYLHTSYWAFAIFRTYYYSNVNCEAIMQFDISSLIGSGVTSDNFQSATLSNLEVINSTGANNINLYLFDLHDPFENGYISSDWWNSGSKILMLCDTRPPVGTVFNDLDVTDAIFNDLFGPGSNEDYFGFIVSVFNWNDEEHTVVFDRDKPTLTITIDQPVPSLSTYNLILLSILFSLIAMFKLRSRIIS